MTVRRGFEGQAYYGAAGATAGTLLTNARDITYNTEPDYADTTVRGDGTAPPIKTQSAVSRTQSIEITMVHDSDDPQYAALQAAAAASTPVAIRTKSYASGKGYDGDCYVAAGNPMPMNGEQLTTFTCTPTRDAGRVPNPWT